MAVCTTCLQPGITTPHDCPGIGEIQLNRKLGHGLIVTAAPPRARMALAVLANTGWGARVQGADCINIGDQVLYQVTGYDPEHAALLLELVEDWRPKPTATCTATWTADPLGTARCTQTAGHYGPGLPDKELRHQGRTPDGSRWEWTDEESGATPHEEQQP
jgi:hypothetical protein